MPNRMWESKKPCVDQFVCLTLIYITFLAHWTMCLLGMRTSKVTLNYIFLSMSLWLKKHRSFSFLETNLNSYFKKICGQGNSCEIYYLITRKSKFSSREVFPMAEWRQVRLSLECQQSYIFLSPQTKKFHSLFVTTLLDIKKQITTTTTKQPKNLEFN